MGIGGYKKERGRWLREKEGRGQSTSGATQALGDRGTCRLQTHHSTHHQVFQVVPEALTTDRRMSGWHKLRRGVMGPIQTLKP